LKATLLEWLFCYVQKIYTLFPVNKCHHGNMEGEKRTCLEQPEVKFQVVKRKLTPQQVDAGKRFFERLVARAQSSIQNESKEVDAKT